MAPFGAGVGISASLRLRLRYASIPTILRTPIPEALIDGAVQKTRNQHDKVIIFQELTNALTL
jgi:hypothetical protein